MGYTPTPFQTPIDKSLLGLLPARLNTYPSMRWEPAIRKAILMFSDQQMVTGIAILGADYSQLSSNISSYHWQILVNLAWFSSLTHLTTLTVLRKYFRDNPTIRTWRAFLMLVTVLMLGVALLPTGNTAFAGDGLPAICQFKILGVKNDGVRYGLSSSDPQSVYILLSTIVLFFGYLTRLIKLSARSTAFARRWIREKPRNILRKFLDKTLRAHSRANGSLRLSLQYVLLEALYVCLRATFDLFESMLWEVCYERLVLSCAATGWKIIKYLGLQYSRSYGCSLH